MVFNQQLMQNMLQSDEVDALPLSLAQSLLLHHLDHPIAVSIALFLRNESPSLPLGFAGNAAGAGEVIPAKRISPFALRTAFLAE